MAKTLDELLEGIDGVLFDLDGVLLDTEVTYTQATRQILGPLADRFDFALKARMMGRAPSVAAKILLDGVGSTMTPDEFNAQKKPILLELFKKSVPKAGAPELVHELQRRGVPMAVATSSDRHYFEAKTGHHAWFSAFSAVVCANDPGVGRHKPAPDVFLHAARHLGVAPSQAIVFEDSAAGVEAARRARVKRIVAIIDPALDPKLVQPADHIVMSFAEIGMPLSPNGE